MKLTSANPNIKNNTVCITGTRIPIAKIVYMVNIKKITPKEIETNYFTQLSERQIKSLLFNKLEIK